MSVIYRVQCTSRVDRDEKTGEPRRWHFDTSCRALAELIAAVQRRPCCSVRCCGSPGADVVIEERP